MFSIGQVFIDSYPEEAAKWCNETQQSFISEMSQDEDGHRRFIIEPIPKKSLFEQKYIKLSEINAAYDAAMSSLVSTYPSAELLTFGKQETEARSWLADNTISTPLIDALVLGRGIDKAELVRRIIAKSDAFAVATGYITGQRQKYEDQLEAATTAEEIEAIVPEYSHAAGA